MNSFKKISLVVSAALAGTMLSVVPASAVPSIAVSVAGTPVTTAAVATTPATVTVPADNAVDAADAVKFELTGIETGTVVNVSVTNASVVTALHDVAAPVNAAAGAPTLSVNTGTGTTAAFYVFTKTTTLGTVVVSNGGNTWTYYVKGTAGPAYNLAVTLAGNGATGATLAGTAKVTDVFGNNVAAAYTVTAINGVVSGVDTTSATTGVDEFAVALPANAGTAALRFALAVAPTDVVGLAKAVKTVDRFVTITDLAVVNAALVAENAALKAEVAAAKTALDAEKAAHAATKAALEAKVAELDARIIAAQAYVVKLKAWITKLQVLVKSLR